MDSIIKNSNGRSYVVLQQSGDYTLLKDITSPTNDEYTVAWGLHEYEGGWCWGQGHYFANLDNALTVYNEKIGKIPTEKAMLSYYRYTCTECGDTFKISNETDNSSVDYCPYCGSYRHGAKDMIVFDTDYCYELGKRHEELECF